MHAAKISLDRQSLRAVGSHLLRRCLGDVSSGATAMELAPQLRKFLTNDLTKAEAWAKTVNASPVMADLVALLCLMTKQLKRTCIASCLPPVETSSCLKIQIAS